LGDLADARDLNAQVLESRHRALGPEHPSTLMAMNNLASNLYALGDLTRARELEEQVLEARRRILSSKHPDTLMSMNKLASTLRAAHP
jgi:hypothetical protein